MVMVLAAGNVWTVFYYKPNLKNPYPLIDISRNFISQEHFITNIEPLRQELRELVQKEGSDSITLYFEFLNTGANISINPNLAVWPASWPKVPMALVAMKKIEKGEWTLDNELVLFEEDRDLKYGELFKKPIGTRLTIETLLREMLARSDNTAYKIFLRNIDFNELNKVIVEVGIEDLFKENGTVSAKEYARLFRALYTSSFLSRQYSERILEWLAEAEFKDFLAAGIPPEAKFAHKFGIDRDARAYLDAGIVYMSNRPYLLSVAVKGTGAADEEERVKNLMKIIGEKTYEYVAKY